MLTIFTTAKPFVGHNAIIQKNALRSWSLLKPKCQIILVGDDPGTREAALEFGALHIPEVSRTEFGMPLINDMFERAQSHAEYPLMCFANADIILTQEFLDTVAMVSQSRKWFLAVGRRWNLDVTEGLKFTDPDWAETLHRNVHERGQLFSHDAMDYFVFPRGLYTNIPPLAVGREGWDNWMIYEARRKRATVLDLTPAVTVVHQNHDYGKFKDASARLGSEETRRNHKFIGDGFFDLRDATHEVTADGRIQASWLRNPRWHLWRACLVYPGLRHILLPLSRIKRTLKEPFGP